VPPFEARVWAKVNKTDTCWLWTGALLREGYGQIGYTMDGVVTRWLAHRLVYTMIKGEIPKGLTLDHLCRVRSCVNPDHLEPVTLKVNLLRGEGVGALNARKTACKRGHPFDAENTYVWNGKRICRECGRENVRRARAKKQAAAPDLLTTGQVAALLDVSSDTVRRALVAGKFPNAKQNPGNGTRKGRWRIPRADVVG
jgi:hypothetical protein